MKTKGIISILILISNVCLATANNSSRKKPITIDKALSSGLIKVRISGKGGHNGSCLKLNITNIKDDSVYITLEAGRRLDSEDEKEQDILVMKEQTFALGKKEQKESGIFGFCCQAHNASPAKDSKFKIGKMADSSLVRLASFISSKPLNQYGISEIQNAVWCLSDGYETSSISQAAMDLRNFVAKEKKEEVPWYNSEYKPGENGRAGSGQTSKITGTIEYTLNSNAILCIQVRDKHGKLLQKFVHQKPMDKGTWHYNFSLEVVNWPKGEYSILLFADDQRIMEKPFRI